MPKVSVIIPVYGVEPYIERCARSLFEQTLDDIEYIFVDDCTPDRSIEILKEVLEDYPERKQQVIIERMPANSGQAAVRKRGIKSVTGEYIIHCDSDDFVDKEMYARMYTKAKSKDYDIVVCDYYEVCDGHRMKKKGKISEMSDLVDDIFLLLLSSTCNKLIKRSIANQPGIVFPERNMGEDLAIMLQYALATSSVGYLPEPLYYYERRPLSISGNRSAEALIDKNRQMVANFNIALDAIARHDATEKYQDAILHEKLWIKNQLLPAMTKFDCYKQWKGTYPEINSKVLSSRMFTWREKANFVITYLGLYPTYCKFIRG